MLKYVYIGILIASGNSVAFCQQPKEARAEVVKEKRSSNLPNDIIKKLLMEIPMITDPTLRVFTRLQVAKHLSDQTTLKKGPDSMGIAKTLVTEALDDVTTNQLAIPGSYKRAFRRDIFILLNKCWPDLVDSATGGRSLVNEESDLSLVDTAQLFVDKATVDHAAGVVRGKLRKRFDPYELFYLVNDLEKGKHPYLTALLSDILVIAEESPNVAWVESFSMLYSFFLSSQQPIELKARFCNVAIKIISAQRNWSDFEHIRYAYGLLTNISPFIDSLTPALTAVARVNMSFLAARLPKSTVDEISMDKLTHEDSNPIDRLLDEAKAAKNELKRDGLLYRAAGEALKKGELQTALDIVMGFDGGSREFAQRKDTLLLEIVGKALDARWPDLAQRACAGIIAKLSRISALEKIGLYHFTHASPQQASELLGEALLLAGWIDNDLDRTKALLRLTQTLLKADESKAPPALKEAVIAMNDIRGLKSQRDDMRESDIQDLITLSYNLSPTFNMLAQKNGLLALNIADTINDEWLKAQALLAIRIGLQQKK